MSRIPNRPSRYGPVLALAPIVLALMTGCEPLVDPPDPLDGAWIRQVADEQGLPRFQTLTFHADGSMGYLDGRSAWAGTFTDTAGNISVVGGGNPWAGSITGYQFDSPDRLLVDAGRAPQSSQWRRLPDSPYFDFHISQGQRLPRNLYQMMRLATMLSRYRDDHLVPVDLVIEAISTQDFAVGITLGRIDSKTAVEYRMGPYHLSRRPVTLTRAPRFALPADFLDTQPLVNTVRQNGYDAPIRMLKLIPWDSGRGFPVWQVVTETETLRYRGDRSAPDPEAQSPNPQSFAVAWDRILELATRRVTGNPGLEALDNYMNRNDLEGLVSQCRTLVDSADDPDSACIYLQQQVCTALGATYFGWGRCS